MKFVCETKCFYNNRRWSVGEILELPDKSSCPQHFKKITKNTKPETIPEEPKTYHEITQKSSKEIIV